MIVCEEIYESHMLEKQSNKCEAEFYIKAPLPL